MEIESSLPLFVCYRRIDGFHIAKWLHGQLHRRVQKIGESIFTLDVYLDVQTPAVPDWTKIHRPYLEASRALIFVATPGAFAALPNGDWVHDELMWWLKHRKVPPIVIDATGEGDRWIPPAVLLRWPNIQRLEFIYDRWMSLSEPQRNDERLRIVGLLCNSFAENTPSVALEQSNQVKSLSNKARTMAILLIAFLCFALPAGLFLQHRNATVERQNASLTEAARAAREKLAFLRLDIVEDKRPPIVTISDTDGHSFEPGSAHLSAEFETNLVGTIIPRLEEEANRLGVDTLEIIGHTDNTPTSPRLSSFDEMPSKQVRGFGGVIPASNVELAMLRALAVATYFEENRTTGRLKSIRLIRCYSAGPFVPLNDDTTPLGNDARRRRIEIRLLKERK
ncbi:MAG TPA: hypothetical protein VNP98_06205 [Chthoniobacterales bacterium]|nr:hypothetical protein [Chthoniobacterales bacterium]